MEQQSEEYRYDAFISYRHKELDRKWAKWLHSSLETYRLPKKLQAKLNLPAKLERIFRDEEELPVSSSLSHQIDQALRQSRFLIVICSKDTPESRWVNQEIIRFREMGRHDNILALLIDGEPYESFPQALCEIRTKLIDEGTQKLKDSIEHVEPLAADVRTNREESLKSLKNMALLRILAMIHGCRFDDLRQRHQERAARRLKLFSVAASTLLAVMVALLLYAVAQKKEADLQRLVAEQRDYDSRSRLASLHVATGWKHISEKNNQLALPWFVKAFRDDPRPTPSKSDHLLRIDAVVASVPLLADVVQSKGKSRILEMSEDGRRIIAKNEASIQLIDFNTREVLGQRDIDKDSPPHVFTTDNDLVILVSQGETGNKIEIFESKQSLQPLAVVNFGQKADLNIFSDKQRLYSIHYIPTSKKLWIETQNSDSYKSSLWMLMPDHEDKYQIIQSWKGLTGFRLSNDHSTLAVASNKEGVIVHNLNDGGEKELTTKDSFTSRSSSTLAFSPDNKLLAIFEGNELKLFSTRSGKMVASAPSVTTLAYQIVFSTKGELIAVLGHTETEIFRLNANDKIEAVGSTPSRNHSPFKSRFLLQDAVFINYTDGRLLLHVMDPGLPTIMTIYLGESAIKVSDPITNGGLLRLFTRDSVQSWDLAIDSLPYQAENPPHVSPSLLTIDSDDRVLYVDSFRRTLYVKKPNAELFSFKYDIGMIEALAVDAKGQVVLGTYDGEILLLNQDDLQLVDSKFKVDQPIKSLEFVNDDQHILVHHETLNDGTLSELSTINLTSEERNNFKAGEQIYSLMHEPGLNTTVAVMRDRIVLLDLVSLKELHTIKESDSMISAASILPSKKLLTVTGRHINTWDLDSLQLVKQVELPELNSFSLVKGFIASKGAYIEMPFDQLSMRLKSIYTGEHITPKMTLTNSTTEKITAIGVSQNQQLIAAMGDKGEIKIWSSQDGSVVRLPYRVVPNTTTGNNSSERILPISIQFAKDDTILIANTLDGLYSRSLLKADEGTATLETLAGVLSNHEVDNTGTLIKLSKTKYTDMLGVFTDNSGELIAKPKLGDRASNMPK